MSVRFITVPLFVFMNHFLADIQRGQACENERLEEASEYSERHHGDLKGEPDSLPHVQQILDYHVLSEDVSEESKGEGKGASEFTHDFDDDHQGGEPENIPHEMF